MGPLRTALTIVAYGLSMTTLLLMSSLLAVRWRCGSRLQLRGAEPAFASLRSGARLVAMHRTMYWRTSKGLQLDRAPSSWALRPPPLLRRRSWASPSRASSPQR
jgi:hypothetical protein